MNHASERGAALLTVLLIVAALSALAVGVLDNLRRSHRLEANAASLAQARWYAIGAEDYAVALADQLRGAGPAILPPGGQRLTLPLDQGFMEIGVADASACINLNSVVAGAGDIYQRHETGAAQFQALLVAIGLPVAQAVDLTDSLVAWIDTGDGRGAPSRDDEPYLRQSPSYMTGREPLAETSELLAIRGFTPEIYARLTPFVCVHPSIGPSIINVNALTVDHAPILVALTEGAIPERLARELIASRPAEGWQSTGEIWSRPDITSLPIPQSAPGQTSLDLRYLALAVHVTHLDAEASMSQLLVDRGGEFVPAARRWSVEP